MGAFVGDVTNYGLMNHGGGIVLISVDKTSELDENTKANLAVLDEHMLQNDNTQIEVWITCENPARFNPRSNSYYFRLGGNSGCTLDIVTVHRATSPLQ